MEKRIYFKNLNALRFFAATAVIFHHVEQYKFLSGFGNAWGNTAIDALGHKAVSFFFVLSGFLISYLLFEEDKKSGEINIRNFYIRRILRIWPLYYLIVSLCLFVLPYVFDLSLMGEGPGNNFWLVTGLLLLVLPNAVRTISPNIIGGNQLWSIGVEEQFYLVWPLMVKWFRKMLLAFFIIFIIAKAVTTLGMEAIVNAGFNPLWMQKLLRIWVLLQVEQMAIGAIGAWVLFKNREKVLRFIYHPIVFGLSMALIAALFVIPIHHWWINYAEAVVFVVFIMNLSTNPAVKFSMEHRVLNTLGNISYGIYMYHTLCITVCLYVLRYMGLDRADMLAFNIVLYATSILSTILVSYISYELFESRFLQLKERFMVVKSGKKEVRPETAGTVDKPGIKSVSVMIKFIFYRIAFYSRLLFYRRGRF